MVPMNTLHALVLRCCFRYNHPMHGEGGHGINAPSVEEEAGLDRSVWGTRWGGAGTCGKDAFLAKQLAR